MSSKIIRLKDINWINGSPKAGQKTQAQIVIMANLFIQDPGST